MSLSTPLVYPGSFDPVTRGHLSVVLRAWRLTEGYSGQRLIVAVATAGRAHLWLDIETRISLIRASLEEVLKIPLEQTGIEILPLEGLLVHFLKAQKARFIIRGLRQVSDFEREIQMANANKALYPEMETLFLPAEDRFHSISASTVREVWCLRGDIRPFVPLPVAQRLEALREA